MDFPEFPQAAPLTLWEKARLNAGPALARWARPGQVDAAATVIAVLLAENTALREQATKQSAVVIPLDRTHFISE